LVVEIRQGIERLRPRNPHRARAYETWLEELLSTFAERILPIDERVAQVWGRINARESFPVIDSLLAATAEAHGLTLVTRNSKTSSAAGCVA
jgi:predicted nucleic acid-binding protein